MSASQIIQVKPKQSAFHESWPGVWLAGWLAGLCCWAEQINKTKAIAQQ